VTGHQRLDVDTVPKENAMYHDQENPMYHDNLREACELARTQGIVSKVLAMQVVHIRTIHNRARAYVRMVKSLERLAIHYLINANR
jgi:hypothetical protein